MIQATAHPALLRAGLLTWLFLSSFTLPRSQGCPTLTMEVRDPRNHKGAVDFAQYNREAALPDEHNYASTLY